MAEYDAKRISELTEATNLTNKDYLVINEFSPATGYTLTKKVTTARLGNYICDHYIKPYLSDVYELSDLAHYDVQKLLNTLMKRGHESYNLGDHSLALSALGDIPLGNLSSMNLEDLNLDQYATKSYATGSWAAGPNEFINGIVQQDGKIIGVSTGRIKDEVPIDTVLDATSENPVQNATVKAALDTKMNIADGSMTHSPVEGVYVAGFKQKNGIVCDVATYQIPKQPIDSVLNLNSANPVENRVVTAKFDEVFSRLTSDMSNGYVNKTNANADQVALDGEYVRGIHQKEGKITSIDVGKNSDITAGVVADLEKLRIQIASDLAALKAYVDGNFVKLSTGNTQTITGPVKFNTKITGSITNADVANQAKWS